jgi:NitT/TauT family transport system substrate-binding protein
MPRQVSRLLVVLIALLMLAGCTPASSPASAPAASARRDLASPVSPNAGGASGSAAPAAATTAPPQPVGRVRIGTQNVAGDIAMFAAYELGYFQQEGLEAEFIPFAGSPEMLPALVTEQIDAAGVGATVAMWNALARGVPIKMVLDKGSFRPGFGFTALLIRKDLYDAGRGHRVDDLRGLSIASLPPGRGGSNVAILQAAMQRVGASIDDIDIQAMAFPDMITALANGAIDGALIGEPFQSRAVRQGSSVRVVGQDEMYPNFTVSTVCFSPTFYANRPAAKAFVRGYIRAARDYIAAKAGRTSEPELARLDEIMSKYTRIDAAVVREMIPVGFSPNALPNQESVLYGYQFFRDQGLIPDPVSDTALAAVWGTELVEEVLNELGRLPES